MTTHKFPYRWQLASGYPATGVTPHGKTVFSTFSCGGGSTMGYKLAGYNVLGCNEIDPEMMSLYRENHNPQLHFLEDIRTFRQRSDLPKELFNLDVLDGSPPCSVFSVAGQREEAWGKEKQFREGQAKQTLDDLFFEFIELAKRLQPKVVIAENVKGMLVGHAKGYVVEIKRRLNEAGYTGQIFILNAASMGVPQNRERIFFVAHRTEFELPKIKLQFTEPPICFHHIQTDGRGAVPLTGKALILWHHRQVSDQDLSGAYIRLFGKKNYFTHRLIHGNQVMKTLVASDQNALFSEPRQLNKEEYCLASTFPLDYNFLKTEPKYVVGMSVPPVMMAQLANQVYEQWLNKM